MTWLKDNDEINVDESEDNRFVATHDGRVYRLEVKESKMIDAGSYSIKVEDKERSCQVMITGTRGRGIEGDEENRVSSFQKRQSKLSFRWATRPVRKALLNLRNFTSN